MRLVSIIVTAFIVSLPGSSAQAVPPVAVPAMAWVTAKLTAVGAIGGGSWTIYEIGDAVCPKCTAAAMSRSKDAAEWSGKKLILLKGGLIRRYEKLPFWAPPAMTPIRKHMPDLYKKQNGRDALCPIPLPALYVGRPWDRRLNPAIHVDHIIPKSKGGHDSVENLQLTLGKYNLQKGDRPWGPAERQKYCPP